MFGMKEGSSSLSSFSYRVRNHRFVTQWLDFPTIPANPSCSKSENRWERSIATQNRMESIVMCLSDYDEMIHDVSVRWSQISAPTGFDSLALRAKTTAKQNVMM